jgi:hypothetical protein
MGRFLHAAGPQRQAKGPLQSRAPHRFGGGGSALAALTLAGEKPARVSMRLPLFSEQLESALRQGDIAIAIAFAGPDVQEHALGIHLRDLQVQAFTQTQAAGVDGAQANAVIEGFDLLENLAHLLGGENHRELELRIGPDQPHFARPGLAQSFLPEKFDRANILSGSLAGEFLLRFEVEEVLAEFFRSDEVRRLAEILAEFANAGPVA